MKRKRKYVINVGGEVEIVSVLGFILVLLLLVFILSAVKSGGKKPRKYKYIKDDRWFDPDEDFDDYSEGW